MTVSNAYPILTDSDTPDDFVAASLSAETSGAFAPFITSTLPAARRLLRSLSDRESKNMFSSRTDNPSAGSAPAPLQRGLRPVWSFSGFASRVAKQAIAGANLSHASLRAVSQKPAVTKISGVGSIHFRADRPESHSLYWEARFDFSVHEEDVIRISFTKPTAAAGTVSMFGIEAVVTDGKASIPAERIRNAVKNGGVSFAASGHRPVPGIPFLKV